MKDEFSAFIENFDKQELSIRLQRRFTDPLTQKMKTYQGIDGISAKLFLKNPTPIIDAVQRQILSPSRFKHPDGSPRTLSRFTHSPYLKFDVPKKTGSNETRPISKSTIRTIIAQQMILDFLNPRLESMFVEESYAYRPGRSPKKALHRVQMALKHGHFYVLDADIQKFFDTVDHNILLSQLEYYFPQHPMLLLLLRRFIKTGYVEKTAFRSGQKIRSRLHGYQPRTIGIPQGGILSGALANIYLHAMDCFIKERFPNVIYIRYADDFLVFSKSWDEIADVCNSVNLFTSGALKLFLHPKKTHIRDLSQNRVDDRPCFVDFLGYRISRDRIIIQPRNLQVFRINLQEVIKEWEHGDKPVSSLVRAVNRRLKGRLYDYALPKGSNFIGKNWTGYFSMASHHGQLKSLDDWLVKEMMKAIRKREGKNVSKRQIRDLRLLNLVKLHYKMRNEIRKKYQKYCINAYREEQSLSNASLVM